MKIILASNSPRRKELLRYILDDFTTIDSQTDESYDENLAPHEIVLYLSYKKAKSVNSLFPNEIIIGCDTIVTLNNSIMGKPRDKADAYRILSELSGKTHKVLTGVTIINNKSCESFYTETAVTFSDISAKEINKYIETTEPFDKAGAYGIQGYGAKFIESIDGDYFSVLGLPINKIYQHLKKFLPNL